MPAVTRNGKGVQQEKQRILDECNKLFDEISMFATRKDCSLQQELAPCYKKICCFVTRNLFEVN
ncbi:hypothetical protein DKC15_019245 (plasmid) [Acinetobacter pittii]|nr:hypothetical protein DKC15_019245 [Acinetobacter pittii]